MRFPKFRALAAVLFGRSSKADSVGSAFAIIGHLPDSTLSEQFIMAAGANDVSKMKELRRRGADINFVTNIKFGASTLIYQGGTHSQPSDDATALMVALYNGAFDAALYLAQEKADATFLRMSIGMHRAENALDLLLTDHGRENVQDTATLVNSVYNGSDAESPEQRRQNHQTDLFTPEQRLQIFDALVQNAKNKLQLATENTLQNAIDWGRWEIIPRLAEIGLEIGDEHFVAAAAPLHRKHMAIETMRAILPFVRNVNVINSSKENAGHRAAVTANLEAFQWLEQQGLNRTSISNTSIPTYAHCVCGAASLNRDDDVERVNFAQYLIEHKYPIDVNDGLEGKFKRRPVDVAFKENRIHVGMAYLAAGASVKPEYLMSTIRACNYKLASPHDVLDLINVLKKRKRFGQDTMKAAFDEVVQFVSYTDENVSMFAPIVRELKLGGLALDEGDQKVASMIIAKNVGVRSLLHPQNRL
jgi:hypothetical protein